MDSSLPLLAGVSWHHEGDTESVRRLTAARGGETVAAAELGTLQQLTESERRANLTLQIQPALVTSEVGRAVLGWGERAARAAFTAEGSGTTLTFAVNLENPSDAERALVAEAGLTLAVAEDQMTRPTANGPKRAFPPGIGLRPWDEMSAPLFFHAYDSAFRDRPGFPNWDEARWRSAFTSAEEFRPELSVVALDGPEPAAFAVLWVEDKCGWVTQMGVRPAWRGKGCGEALLSHALRAFAAEGLPNAMLEVATNNAAASALYSRMGFSVISTYESWRKRLH